MSSHTVAQYYSSARGSYELICSKSSLTPPTTTSAFGSRAFCKAQSTGDANSTVMRTALKNFCGGALNLLPFRGRAESYISAFADP